MAQGKRTTKPLQIYMPPRLRMDIDAAAEKIGVTSASSYARQAIVEKMQRDKNNLNQQQTG